MTNSISHTLNVYKQSIISLDTSPVKLISELVAEEAGTDDYFDAWDILIFGYADDPRGLYNIPEVRRWCQQAVSEFPFLPSVLTKATFNQWFVFCLVEVESVGDTGKVRASSLAGRQVFQNAQEALIRFLRAQGIERPEKIILKSLARVLRS